jgi:hypothetical protein
MLSLYATIEEKAAAAITGAFKYKRVGGLRFLRLGSLQLSFCVVKKKAAKRPLRNDYDARRAASLAASQALRPIYQGELNLSALSQAHWIAEYKRQCGARGVQA